MPYKIGSFNCLNFGMGSSKDIQKFVDIILGERFDILALQEIRGEKALDRILAGLDSKWASCADEKTNDYAFIWNTNRVDIIDPDRPDARKSYPRTFSDRRLSKDDLARTPFYARFYPVGGGAPFIEIRIINTHIRFSKNNGNENELKSRQNST